MKKIMIAALGLSLLSGTAVFAAEYFHKQPGTDTNTMKSTKKSRKKKNKGSSDTMSSTTSTNPVS